MYMYVYIYIYIYLVSSSVYKAKHTICHTPSAHHVSSSSSFLGALPESSRYRGGHISTHLSHINQAISLLYP